MRLLHTTKLTFEEFFADKIPKYAILSHRWGADEVSYQDFLAGRKRNGVGYGKIIAFCGYAVADSERYRRTSTLSKSNHGPFNWVWIDTCCIDKTSSAELSEAVNSMYEWYAKAAVCYVYLSDVTKKEDEDVGEMMNDFRESKWFSRGWTLQELLAPENVIFLDSTWTRFGARLDLVSHIAKTTGISETQVEMFWNKGVLFVNAKEKLSWAAGRETSRLEDQAYCLLGILGINMPLLYGEGENAFRRLQSEIVNSSNDESVFAWDSHIAQSSSGLLPASAEAYKVKDSGHETDFVKVTGKGRPPYSITNQGMALSVPKALSLQPHFILPLNCVHREKGIIKGAYAVLLEKIDHDGRWDRALSIAGKNLPKFNETVHRSGNSLFIVPVDWVWSREDLTRRGSEVIYVKVFNLT